MSSLTDYLKLIKPARLEKYSVNNYNDNFDSLDKAIEKLPRGVIIARSRSSTSGAISHANLDTVNPVTLKGGRMYEFIFDSVNFATNADTVMQVILHKAATTDAASSVDNMTRLGLKSFTQLTFKQANLSQSSQLSVVIPQVADETFQLKITYQRVSGTGTVACDAMNWVLKDIGPNIGANL